MILPQLKVHWKKVSHAQLGQGRSQIFGSMSLFWMLDKHNWIPSYWSLLNNYVGNRAVDGGAEGSNEHCGQNINHKQQNGFLKLYSPIFIHKLSFPLFSSLHFFILDWLSIEEHAAFPPTFSHTIAGTLFCAQWSDPAFLILQKKSRASCCMITHSWCFSGHPMRSTGLMSRLSSSLSFHHRLWLEVTTPRKRAKPICF